MYLFTRKSIQSSSPIGATLLATPSILQRYNSGASHPRNEPGNQNTSSLTSERPRFPFLNANHAVTTNNLKPLKPSSTSEKPSFPFYKKPHSTPLLNLLKTQSSQVSKKEATHRKATPKKKPELMAEEKEEFVPISQVDLDIHRNKVAHITPGGDNAIDNLVRNLHVLTPHRGSKSKTD